MAVITWRSDEEVRGTRRREFVARHGNGIEVPTVVSTPIDASGPLPLILMAHGGSHHKTHPATNLLRERLMIGGELAVATIDFPEHGERGRLDSLEDPAFIDFLADPAQFDQASADLSLVLTELLSSGEFNPDAVAYWGVSLGGWFGFPFIADETRLCAAVLGLIGTGYAMLDAVGHARPSHAAWERAPEIAVPVAFIVQWNDQLVPREDALDAFDLIGTSEKRLFVAPGEHAMIPTDIIDATRDFLSARFGGKPLPGPVLAPLLEM